MLFDHLKTRTKFMAIENKTQNNLCVKQDASQRVLAVLCAGLLTPDISL